MRIDLFYKQISLIFIISDRKGGNCKEKIVSLIYHHIFQILVLLTDKQVFFFIYILDWNLKFSSFLQYLAITLKLTFPIFLPPF